MGSPTLPIVSNEHGAMKVRMGATSNDRYQTKLRITIGPRDLPSTNDINGKEDRISLS